MNIKINFHQMPHSDGLDKHAREKLTKVSSLLKRAENLHPITAELFLNAQATHAHHHEVELRVKSGSVSASAHETNADMYMAIDSVVDKVITQIKKEKTRTDDKRQKVHTEKTNFGL
ncbi:MAG: hypothetical protein QG632_259 [Candidatus Dependentiae bacterium]|nr:hypothetical protein [Candidatus Dependentiae bacterium]